MQEGKMERASAQNWSTDIASVFVVRDEDEKRLLTN